MHGCSMNAQLHPDSNCTLTHTQLGFTCKHDYSREIGVIAILMTGQVLCRKLHEVRSFPGRRELHCLIVPVFLEKFLISCISTINVSYYSYLPDQRHLPRIDWKLPICLLYQQHINKKGRKTNTRGCDVISHDIL